jgi:hypothetical protein
VVVVVVVVVVVMMMIKTEEKKVGKIMRNLGRSGRSKALPDAYQLLTSGPAFR